MSGSKYPLTNCTTAAGEGWGEGGMRPKPLSFRPTICELSINRIKQKLMLVSFLRGHKEATNAWMVGSKFEVRPPPSPAVN